MVQEKYHAKTGNTDLFIRLQAELSKVRGGISKSSSEAAEGCIEELMGACEREGFYIYDTNVISKNKPVAVMVCLTDKNYDGVAKIVREIFDKELILSSKMKQFRLLPPGNQATIFESNAQGYGFLSYEDPVKSGDMVEFAVDMVVDRYGGVVPFQSSKEKKIVVPKEHYLPALFDEIKSKEIKILFMGPNDLNIDLELAEIKKSEIEEFYRKHAKGNDVPACEAEELAEKIKIYLAALQSKAAAYKEWMKDAINIFNCTFYAVVGFDNALLMADGFKQDGVPYITLVQHPAKELIRALHAKNEKVCGR